MNKPGRTAARIAWLAVSAAMMAGCAQTRGWLDGMAPKPKRSDENVILGAPNAEDYLRDLERLATGDPATQAEIYADAESRATLTPDPSTLLKFALVLATPGHSGTDIARAQTMLRELLTRTPVMTQDEISFARIYLQSVEERLVRAAETRRLRESTSRQAETEERAISQRLAAVEAENRRLRSQLEDAESKLEAITSIERSIREQGQ